MFKFIKENLNSDLIKNKSGIYKIICKDHFYIGSSKNLSKRLYSHIKSLKSNSHHNHTMQNCFNKYGIEEFWFEIIEYCDVSILIERESFYIKFLNPDINHILDPVNIIRDKEYCKLISKSKKEYFKTHDQFNIKEVHQYSLSGEYINSFKSITEAAKNTGNSSPTDICACCNGRSKSARKYRWSFNKVEKLPPLSKNNKHKIYQLDYNFNIIKEWFTLSDIEKKLHISRTTIKKYLNKNILYKNCFWVSDINSVLNFDKNININKIISNSTCKNINNIFLSKKVYQYSLDGFFIQEFPSTREAERYLSNILCKKIPCGIISSSARENTKNKSAYGYQWSYVKSDKINSYINNSAKSKNKEIYLFDIIDNNIIKYISIAEAVRNLCKNNNFNCDCAALSSICRHGGIFKRRYLVSNTELFVIPSRNKYIVNLLDNKIYTLNELCKKTKLTASTITKLIKDTSFNYKYLNECAREKLRESGKLLNKDNPNPSVIEI